MEPIPAPIADQLAALDHRIRWLTAVCTLLGLGLVLMICYRFVPTQPELAANKFVLVDPHGRVRGQFTQWADGTPVLELDGQDGQQRLLLLASADGSSGLRILDSSRTHRVYLQCGSDGWPGLVLTGPRGQTLLRLATGPNGVGRIERRDTTGTLLDPHPAP